MQSELPLSPELHPGDNLISRSQDHAIDQEEEVAFHKNDDSEFATLSMHTGDEISCSASSNAMRQDPSESLTSSSSVDDLVRRRGRAVMVMLFCVLTDSMNVQCASPNYPLMVSPGAHPDSFPSTEPFEFAAAQHMISAAASGGAFFGYLVGAGWLAGKIGQRHMVLWNMLGSTVLTCAKYYWARHDYWTFVALSFANGCFSSTWAVGLAYMAELFWKDRVKGDTYMGHVNAVGVVGRTAGGLLAVMTPNRLFVPLVSAAIISASGLVLAYCFLPDAHQLQETQDQEEEESPNVDALDLGHRKESSANPPSKLDTVTLVNILGGLFIDYAGSMGLLSFSLSPLMFETFYYNFVEDGLDPIMSEQTYRILYSTAAACIAAGAIISPWLFQNLGVAVSCILANLLTAGFTIGLLYIALVEPVTRVTFVTYTIVLYVGYALSMVSNLSAGPMLDRITPAVHIKGFVQGINAAIMDGTWSIFPILYALIVDNFGIALAMWISAGLCCLAALVNLPLAFHPSLVKEESSSSSSSPSRNSRNQVECFAP